MTSSTSTSRPVLILNSSCADDSSWSAADALSSPEVEHSEEDTEIWNTLSSSSIACDMLILPEIPTLNEESDGINSSSSSDAIEISEARLNPCGMSNILVLEGLSLTKSPASNTKFLLSLTSCSLLDTTTQASTFFPVEPIPSAFAFGFDKIEGGRFVSEVDISFDLSHAMNQLLISNEDAVVEGIEVLQAYEGEKEHFNSTLPADQVGRADREDLRQEDRNTESHSNTQTLPIDPLMTCLLGTDSFVGTCSDLPQRMSGIRSHVNQNREVIIQVKAILEQEEKELTTILIALGGIGIVLFAVYLWIELQYSWDKKDVSVRRRASSLSQGNPTLVPMREVRMDRSVNASNVSISESMDQISELPRASLGAKLEAANTTPQRKVGPSCITPPPHKGCVSPSLIPQALNTPCNTPEHCLWHRSPPRNQVVTDTPHAARNITDSKNVTNCEQLSPCSKLEIAWTQRKERRSSGRKRRQQKIHPAIGMPNNALKRSSEKSQIDQTKTGPNAPAARTELSTSSHMPRGASPESDRSSEGRTPILPNTPPALPELCSTPGSDDSFVEDYW